MKNVNNFYESILNPQNLKKNLSEIKDQFNLCIQLIRCANRNCVSNSNAKQTYCPDKYMII